MSALNSKITTEKGDFLVLTKASYLLFMTVPRSSVMPFRTGDFLSTPGLQIQYNTSDPRILTEWHEMLCTLIGKGLFRVLCECARVGYFPYPEGKEHLEHHVKRLVPADRAVIPPPRSTLLTNQPPQVAPADNSIESLRKKAEAGDASSQCALGVCYDNGEGIEKDTVEAVKWYRKAAEQGNAKAQYVLGVCYYNGEGIEKHLVEAAKWMRKAAEQGDAKAQCSLGNFYYKGDGVEKDAVDSAKWYRKAADQGDAMAQGSLGVCYEKGNGVEKDSNEAVKWYRKAADQGLAQAQFALGVHLIRRCVIKHEVEGLAWLYVSSANGNEGAAKVISSKEKIYNASIISAASQRAKELQAQIATPTPSTVGGAEPLSPPLTRSQKEPVVPTKPMKISISRDGVEIGEWPENDVRTFYREGSLLGTDYYWREGMEEWKPLLDLVKPPPPRPTLKETDAPALSTLSQSTIDWLKTEKEPDLPLQPDLGSLQPPVVAEEKRGGIRLPAKLAQVAALLVGLSAIMVGQGLAKAYPDIAFIAFVGAILGAVLGLIPYFLARNYLQYKKPGRYFWIIVGAGAIGGLWLSVPATLVEVVYLLHKKKV